MVMGTAVVAGLGSFLLTVPAFSVNTLGSGSAVRVHADPTERHRGRGESVGDLINQTVVHRRNRDTMLRALQAGRSNFAITWRTYLQSSFDQGDPAFHVLMQGAVPIKSFSGAVRDAPVWKQGDLVRRLAVRWLWHWRSPGAAACDFECDPPIANTPAYLGKSDWPVLGVRRPVTGGGPIRARQLFPAQVRMYGERTLAYIRTY